MNKVLAGLMVGGALVLSVTNWFPTEAKMAEGEPLQVEAVSAQIDDEVLPVDARFAAIDEQWQPAETRTAYTETYKLFPVDVRTAMVDEQVLPIDARLGLTDEARVSDEDPGRASRGLASDVVFPVLFAPACWVHARKRHEVDHAEVTG